MAKLKTAVIGVGYLGKFHAQKYAAHPEAELVGVVDSDREAADRVAKDCGTQAFYDYRDLLGKVNAVSVAVPTGRHFQISQDFLEHEADVLIEKPMTNTLEEADALIDLSEHKGLIIQVGHLERFNPAVLALDGVVKKPLFIEAQRMSSFKPRALNVSVVLDLMIHDIDIIQSLAGARLQNIRSTGVSVVSEHLDVANARLEFENGCVASVTASRMSQNDMRKLRIFQKDACISVDFANRRVAITKPEDKGEEGLGLGAEESTFETADALAAEIGAFINSSIKREAPQVTGQVGRDALATALTIMAQVKQDQK
ncbi:Predicted dehydrogenase [Desulfatibacillum alkenivorans DSM 16219]|jgi:predicted dehydrogenase|uniref:Predicted dehydrogenase n=1 Tax=Desulfatibacillum alkenivorans DSM 16219 TaxID=1121393 RepID=A0A1M6CLU3_9BACT|nr:Gfo/Idh/MocA family oxidoreductase [Desulfatibacillum alkenivorans]SHI61678.1 Predicted dehydrogenase [Desulfatibacillum alkenivorans DSM 16219]